VSRREAGFDHQWIASQALLPGTPVLIDACRMLSLTLRNKEWNSPTKQVVYNNTNKQESKTIKNAIV